MDVLTAAWVGAGSPTPHATSLTGDCSHCGSATSWSRCGPWCPSSSPDSTDGPTPRVEACARDAPGGTPQPSCALEHTWSPETRQAWPLDRAGVAALLRSGPLGTDSALVVPLRPGRKHLLPMATWGRVAVEDVDLGWNHQELARLRQIDRLRALGFGSRMLTAAAPPFQVMRTLTPEQFPQVLDAWSQLEPWRQPGTPGWHLPCTSPPPPRRRADDDEHPLPRRHRRGEPAHAP